MLLLLFACASEPADAPERGPAPPDELGAAPAPAPPRGGPGLDKGQKHPPLPADNPMWTWDAQGFVADPRWYGEHDWSGVRMRLAGHLAVAGRDRARLAAQGGDFEACSQRYLELDADLQALPAPSDDWSSAILQDLREAAQRDAALCGALARGEAPPAGEGLAGLRARALAGETGLDAELQAYERPREDLDIASFEDFDDRHRLRARLFAAYLDSVDPLGFSEPWGYWTADQVALQARALRETQGRPLEATSRARELQPAPDYTVEGLGWLPTGDSLIDVGAQPGPKAIGSLTKLGLDDEAHRAWLGEVERSLDEAAPAQVPGLVRGYVQHLDAYGHGSRFYNIKQLRNEAVRQLARGGEHALALEVLEANWPLHNQDWACPNREGILLALKGRLQALAGQPEADGTLALAQAAGRSFLEDVARAERGEEVGVRPPAMGPPPGGQPGGQPPGGQAPPR